MLTPDSDYFNAFMDYLKSTYVDSWCQDFGAEFGPKYIRVFSVRGGSKSVYCFIERVSGNVLKAASWKSPAKWARGNIIGPPSGFGVGVYGADYLR